MNRNSADIGVQRCVKPSIKTLQFKGVDNGRDSFQVFKSNPLFVLPSILHFLLHDSSNCPFDWCDVLIFHSAINLYDNGSIGYDWKF